MKTRVCELCSAEAAVYCPSDSAFLCRSCDAKVHHANFLASRHLRLPVCSACKGIIGFQPCSSICSCSSASAGDDLLSMSYSESSICVSSTTTPKREYSSRQKTCEFYSSSSVYESSGEVSSGKDTRSGGVVKSFRSKAPSTVDFKAKGIFVNWCARLGLSGEVAITVAIDALRLCLKQWTILPFSVSLAASMWLGLRFCREKGAPTPQLLRSLEEVSGVPAKLIVAAESKLERVLVARRRQRRRQHLLAEGWGEC